MRKPETEMAKSLRNVAKNINEAAERFDYKEKNGVLLEPELNPYANCELYVQNVGLEQELIDMVDFYIKNNHTKGTIAHYIVNFVQTGSVYRLKENGSEN